MTCDNCGKKSARVRRKTQTFGRGKDLLVIENIPIISCPDCGESYLTAKTLHEIERIRTHRKQVAVERPIPVARYVA